VSSTVMQRFARVSMLGIDVEARTDLADEPCVEAEDLGRLLEYKDYHMCRRLVRRLLDDGRLSRTAFHSGSPQNSADNSGLSVATQRPTDVFVVHVDGQLGVRPGTIEQLWLTERACLLVATASDTDRAWQVREALVDFFVQARKQRAGGDHRVLDEARAMVDEARAIRADVARQLDLDKRVRQLEARRGEAVEVQLPLPLSQMRNPGLRIPAAELVDELARALAASGRPSLKTKDALLVRPELARFGATPHKLGIALRYIRGVTVDGRFAVGQPDRKGIMLWSIAASE
jgi:hypothetical protein